MAIKAKPSQKLGKVAITVVAAATYVTAATSGSHATSALTTNPPGCVVIAVQGR